MFGFDRAATMGINRARLCFTRGGTDDSRGVKFHSQATEQRALSGKSRHAIRNVTHDENSTAAMTVCAEIHKRLTVAINTVGFTQFVEHVFTRRVTLNDERWDRLADIVAGIRRVS